MTSLTTSRLRTLLLGCGAAAAILAVPTLADAASAGCNAVNAGSHSYGPLTQGPPGNTVSLGAFSAGEHLTGSYSSTGAGIAAITDTPSGTNYFSGATGGSGTFDVTIPSGGSTDVSLRNGNSFFAGTASFSSVMCVAVPPPPVPTLTEWSMIGLTALLGGFAFWQIRRRREQETA